MKKVNYLLMSLSMISIVGCSVQTQITPATSATPSAQSVSSSPTVVPSSSVSPSSSVTPDQPQSEQQQTIKSIVSGTSFGMCVGYCDNQVEFVSGKAIISKKATRDSASGNYPEVRKEDTSFTAEDWNNLVKLADTQKFNSLEERIGCPDCADGGAEFIELTTGSGTKKVTFEFGKDVPEISALVTKLRELRNKYLDTVK